MVGWHHQLNGHEFEEALGVGDGQGSLAKKLSDTKCKKWKIEKIMKALKM